MIKKFLQQFTLEKKFSKFLLGAAYRPMVVRPGNVRWEFIGYDQPSQELQWSEFVPRRADHLPAANKSSGETEKEEKSDENKWRALKLAFDLPPGSYATMALRELLHGDFSKAAHKSRELGGQQSGQIVAVKSEII
jgi:tRNA pseudouridine13 synthase